MYHTYQCVTLHCVQRLCLRLCCVTLSCRAIAARLLTAESALSRSMLLIVNNTAAKIGSDTGRHPDALQGGVAVRTFSMASMTQAPKQASHLIDRSSSSQVMSSQVKSCHAKSCRPGLGKNRDAFAYPRCPSILRFCVESFAQGRVCGFFSNVVLDLAHTVGRLCCTGSSEMPPSCTTLQTS